MPPHKKIAPIVLTARDPETALRHLEHERRRRDGEAAEYGWQTKDGRVVLLRLMDDKHLNNTIKMLQASIFNRKYNAIRHGEHVIDIWDRE